MPIINAVKSGVRRLFVAIYPKPLGMPIGPGSAILFPRQIEGRRSIAIGENTIIGKGVWLTALRFYKHQKFNPKIVIGSNVRMGRNAIISAIEEVAIADGCLFSGDVFITDHTHGHLPSEVPPAQQPLIAGGPVRIGKNCFIGIRVAIMPGVTLGDYCVVGANSVVTKSFPERCVIAGAPARLIRTLSPSEAR